MKKSELIDWAAPLIKTNLNRALTCQTKFFSGKVLEVSSCSFHEWTIISLIISFIIKKFRWTVLSQLVRLIGVIDFIITIILLISVVAGSYASSILLLDFPFSTCQICSSSIEALSSQTDILSYERGPMDAKKPKCLSNQDKFLTQAFHGNFFAHSYSIGYLYS